MTDYKITEIDSLVKIAESYKSYGKKIVLCHGTFDLMHTGHIRYLERAKKEGDVLFVTVTADKFVNKGPDRPFFNEFLRAENIAALQCVDHVGINYSLTAVDALLKIKPSLYVKGGEYQDLLKDVTGNILKEKEAVEKNGGKIFFTNEITFSSSSLLNEHFNVLLPETKEFIGNFTKNFSSIDLPEIIDSFGKLNVLVVGDAIIDEYNYVLPLGQTGKGNVLSVQYQDEEMFAGGSLAVANHIAQFTKTVTLLTGLGDINSHENFIREKLNSSIKHKFIYFNDAPTVLKRRFVDADLVKLFEVYFSKDHPNLANNGDEAIEWLNINLPQYDLVVVADFGNGFISNRMVNILCKKARYLAVNTQINSGNRGFHVISRYPRADYVALNEPELRLAAHNRHDSLEEICDAIAQRLDVEHFAVTRGTKGAMWFDKAKNEFNRAPALSSKVVDRIGAGDAFLSLSSLCIASGAPPEVANLIGSVAAAIDVQIVCNREPIDAVRLKKYISTLFK